MHFPCLRSRGFPLQLLPQPWWFLYLFDDGGAYDVVVWCFMCGILCAPSGAVEVSPSPLGDHAGSGLLVRHSWGCWRVGGVFLSSVSIARPPQGLRALRIMFSTIYLWLTGQFSSSILQWNSLPLSRYSREENNGFSRYDKTYVWIALCQKKKIYYLLRSIRLSDR